MWPEKLPPLCTVTVAGPPVLLSVPPSVADAGQDRAALEAAEELVLPLMFSVPPFSSRCGASKPTWPLSAVLRTLAILSLMWSVPS